MHKLIAPILFALVTTFGRPAAAEQPCVGASSTCAWTCNQDDQGNILSYNVTCNYSDYCVDAASNDWNFGACESQAPAPTDPFDAIAEAEIRIEKVAALVCE